MNYGLLNGYRNCECTPWNDETKSITFKSLVKVKGSLLVSETRCIQMWENKILNEDMIVMELDAKTLDTPYCDSFSCKEAWIAVRSSHDKNTIMFGKYMKVHFIK